MIQLAKAWIIFIETEVRRIGGTVLQAVSIAAAAFVVWMMLSIVYRSWRNGISPMPSSAPVRRAAALELNRLQSGGSLVEAGSGWGTLLLHLAKHCPGWSFTGIENSIVPLWVSHILSGLAFCFEPEAFLVSRGSMVFTRGDMYDYPYETVNVVVCYLYPGAMKRLGPILRQRMAPGSKVISICFAVPDWQADRTVVCKDVLRTKLYVYTVM
jgi:hypothetical protein